MTQDAEEREQCAITGRWIDRDEAAPVVSLRQGVLDLIRRDHPDLPDDGFIGQSELNRYRVEYVQRLLEADLGELTSLERDVIDSLKDRELLSADLKEELERPESFGERLADRFAAFGGSWTFILLFGSVLVVWILVNGVALAARAFDPYPFILLNLVLSCIAALQAPVIMMSQNRVESRDRSRAENDYKINLKAELEIRQLHEKMDHLQKNMISRMFETQQIQIDLLTELASRRAPARPAAQKES